MALIGQNYGLEWFFGEDFGKEVKDLKIELNSFKMWALFGPTTKFEIYHFIFILIFIFISKNTKFSAGQRVGRETFSFHKLTKFSKGKIFKGTNFRG